MTCLGDSWSLYTPEMPFAASAASKKAAQKQSQDAAAATIIRYLSEYEVALCASCKIGVPRKSIESHLRVFHKGVSKKRRYAILKELEGLPMPESPTDFEPCPDGSPPLAFLLPPKPGFCCPDCPAYKTINLDALRQHRSKIHKAPLRKSNAEVMSCYLQKWTTRMGAFTTPYWIVGSEVNEPIFMNLNLKRSKSIGFELRGVVIDLICTKHDEPIGQIDQFRPKKRVVFVFEGGVNRISLTMAAIPSTKKVDIIPLCRDNPAYQDVDTVSIDGLKYRRASKIAKTGRQHRVKPSVAWQHAELLTRERDQQQMYYCYLCESQRQPQQLPLNNEGSKPALNHILRVHKINSNGEVIQPTPPTAQPTMNPSLFFNVVSTYDFDEFKRLLIRWIVYCQVAFAMLENEYFRELVTFLNKTVGGLLPRARATLRRWIMAEFRNKKRC